MRVALLLAIPAILVLAACQRQSEQPSSESFAADTNTTAIDNAVAATNASAAMPHFTKGEFRAHVLNMTKAQVRGEFGSPAEVDDGSDEWVYPSLPVYDEDAGTRVDMTKIRFAGLNGPTDFVADVTY